MVEFSKTKEFLDSAIKISFPDTFAFQILVGFKPVFTQKSTTIKRQEVTQANMDLNTVVLDMNASAPEADNYNKYVIVSDVIKNRANLEPATSLDDITTNIKKFEQAVASSQASKLATADISAAVISYNGNLSTVFIQNMIEFLKDNQLFWENLRGALLEMDNMSFNLRTRVENSK